MSVSIFLVLIWLLSGLVVIIIGQKRGIKFGRSVDFALMFFGPLVIPYALLCKKK